MKQFEIVTDPIETAPYRDFTINEYQGAVVVLQVMYESGLRELKRNISNMKHMFRWLKRN